MSLDEADVLALWGTSPPKRRTDPPPIPVADALPRGNGVPPLHAEGVGDETATGDAWATGTGGAQLNRAKSAKGKARTRTSVQRSPGKAGFAKA